MKLLRTVLAALIALIGLPALSAPPQEKASYSYYVISCASYLKHRTHAGADANNTANAFYVAGWLSAYDRVEAGEGGIPEDTTLDDVMLWLEQYCQAAPERTLEEALFRLGEEVRPRHAAAKQAAKKPAPAAVSASFDAPAPRHAAHPKAKPVQEASPAAPAQLSHDVAEDLKPLTY